jgi:hypothetical protein
MKLYLVLISYVAGWGGEGHRIVTDLALSMVRDTTLTFLESHLGTIGAKTMARVSTWADSPDAISKYPNSASYHFSNTPYRDCSPFVFSRDCGRGSRKGICIVTALADSIQKSSDIDAPVADRADALRFLIHLMADIHQPLHTGFRADTGGLRINLGAPSGLNLHDIWDNWMIEKFREHISTRGRQAGTKEIVEHLLVELGRSDLVDRATIFDRNLTVVFETMNDTIAFTSELASETVMQTTCDFAYKDVVGQFIGVGDYIGQAYFESRLDVLKTQLIRSAVRLAAVLDEVSAALWGKRVLRKEVARAVRIARLFEERESAVVEPTRSARRIAEMEIDFNADELISKHIALPAPKLPKAKTRKHDKAKKVDESTILDAAIAAANRDSYVFNGIDLLSILMQRSGENHMHISTKQAAGKSRRFTPDANYLVPIHFAGNTTSTRRSFQFLFDLNAFTREILTDEFVVRVILHIRGIDPRIDVTDYLGGEMGDFKIERTVVNTADPRHERTMILQAESCKRQRLFAKRLATLAKDGIHESMITEMTKYKDEICFFPVGSEQTVLILPSTLASIDNFFRLHSFATARTRIVGEPTRMGYVETERFEHTYLIDPAIFPGPVEVKDRKEFARLIDYITRSNRLVSENSIKYRPTWLQELRELDMSLRPAELQNREFLCYRIADILIYKGNDIGSFGVIDIETHNITSIV